MSTKKISAGDILTVGGLTDDHLGAVIEVGPIEGITKRFRLGRIERDDPRVLTMWTAEDGIECALWHRPVTVLTPPPVVQPDEPTVLGQCIRIEGSGELLGVVADPGDPLPIRAMDGGWMDWEEALSRAGDRQIIVSDPPRWPDDVEYSLKAGITFDRIEDLPDGWIAKVTFADGTPWGRVVRHDEGWVTHRWDCNYAFAHMVTDGWNKCGEATRSGGSDGGTHYTLVETVEDHDERIRSERVVPERIEVGEWPDDDTHLRAWEWTDADGDAWRWYDEPNDEGEVGWAWFFKGRRRHNPISGPWTRGERLTEIPEDAS